ncbi:MAG: cytochrome c oxidase subunit 3 [Myxococcota bacterium]
MSHPAATPRPSRELSGGTVVWLFVAIELVTFGLFFVAFAAARRSDPASFVADQTQLHHLLGTLNTCVLLTGGWLAARGVLANRRDQPLEASAMLWGAAASGVAFMAIKLHEYGEVLGAGVSLSTSAFWFFYLFVTGLHFLHVLAGVGFLVPTAWRAARGAYGSDNSMPVEAVAVFWHLVDLIWVFLFPLFYLVGRP